jgi:hypothetical protein
MIKTRVLILGVVLGLCIGSDHAWMLVANPVENTGI